MHLNQELESHVYNSALKCGNLCTTEIQRSRNSINMYSTLQVGMIIIALLKSRNPTTHILLYAYPDPEIGSHVVYSVCRCDINCSTPTTRIRTTFIKFSTHLRYQNQNFYSMYQYVFTITITLPRTRFLTAIITV